MSSVEDELKKFRKRTNKIKISQSLKDKFSIVKESLKRRITFTNLRVDFSVKQNEQIHNDTIDEDEKQKPWTKLDIAILILKCLLYIIFQIVAVIVGFGAVFFSISLLIFIFTNLGERRRKKGELSAYSVFNPNCQAIHGSFESKKLEDQLTIAF